MNELRLSISPIRPLPYYHTASSAEEKRLVEQLAQQPGFQHAESVKNQNIFERMKSFFR